MKSNLKEIHRDEFYLVDEFLLKNFSSPTHRKEWNLVISKYFNTEFFYFSYFRDDMILGICPIHSIKNKITNYLISGPKQYLIPYGGWIFGSKVAVNPDFFDLKKNETLEVFSLPVLNEFNAEYEGLNVLKNYETAIIDLEQSEDDIWNSLNQKRRNMVRKAVKNEVQISFLSEDKLPEFYEFYLKANKQYSLENLPFGYFEDLVKTKNNIDIDFLIAKKDECVFGYNVIVSDKNYSIYWLGIRLKETENNGSFDLLQWESIKKSKERNCKYYDLCYVEKERLPNIYKFKTDFSDKLYPILNFNKKSIVYRLINKARKITG